MITFHVYPTQLLNAEGELLVSTFFSDLIPLRGDASWIDWRLNGQVSQLLLAGKPQGHFGEAILLPSRGKLNCPKVLLMGLGDSSEVSSEKIVEIFSRIIEVASKMQVKKLVTGVFGREVISVDYEQAVTDMIDGLLAGFHRLYSNNHHLILTLVEEEKRQFVALLKGVRFSIDSFNYRFLAYRDKSYISGNRQES